MSNKIDYKKINYGFALFKMLLAFEVLLGHFANWDEYDPRLVWPFRELVSITVPCFVILSFYLMCKSFLIRDDNKFKNRLTKLIIPQIGWAIIYFIIYILLDFFKKTNMGVTFIDFLWQLFTGHSRVLNPSMWYQVVVILLTIVFYYIFKYLDDKKGIIALIVLTIFSYYLQFSGINRALFGELIFELKYPLGRIAEMIPFATMGFLLKYYNVLDYLKKYRYIVMPLCVFMFMMGFRIPWTELKDFNFSGFAKPYLALWVVTFAYVFPFDWLKLKYKKAILKITDYSLGIYCAHRLINRLLEVFLPKLALHSFEKCILLYAVCYAACYFIDLIPNKYTKLLVK